MILLRNITEEIRSLRQLTTWSTTNHNSHVLHFVLINHRNATLIIFKGITTTITSVIFWNLGSAFVSGKLLQCSEASRESRNGDKAFNRWAVVRGQKQMQCRECGGFKCAAVRRRPQMGRGHIRSFCVSSCSEGWSFSLTLYCASRCVSLSLHRCHPSQRFFSLLSGNPPPCWGLMRTAFGEF